MPTTGHDTPAASPDEPAAARRPIERRLRRWRRFKWTLRVVVIVPLLLLIAVLALMRSPTVGRMVADEVRRLSGGEWTASRAIITLNGQLLVTNLRLRAPGIDGPAGQLLAADEAIADIDWLQTPLLKWTGLGGAGSKPIVTVIRLTRPVIRVSQSMDDESINLTALKPSGQAGGAADLPRIDVIEGRIEFAEHSTAREQYDALNALPINGSLLPVGNGQPAFNVRLQEIGRVPIVVPTPSGQDSGAGSADRSSLILDGHIDLASERGSLKLYYVSLDAWPAEAVPSRYRALWRQLGLQGQVTEASFQYSPQERLSLRVKVANVAIVVPVPASRTGDEDSYLGLRGVTGDIGLTTAGLTADLTGVMDEQTEPVHVELATRGLDFTSGFRCQITGRRINVPGDAGLQSYVPEIARQYLDWFGGPTAEVDTRVVIERGDPVNGQAAPITVPDGQLNFRKGRAAFHKFPYWFHDMAGEVRFDDQTIRIIQITGTGSSGSPLRASGTITPISDDAQVDLRIDVDQVPVNDELLAAMPPVHRRLMEVLFSQARYDDLIAKGLIRTDAPASAAAVDPATRSADAGSTPPFALGGSADVRIRVERPPGPDVDWATNVDVTFARAGLVPEPFPFPIVGSDLKLRITDNDAVFKSGRFAGLRGGEAVVQASVTFADAAGQAPEPNVRIEATDIPIDPLLINALPGDETAAAQGDDAEIDARTILNRLDIRGSVDCRVTITSPQGTNAEQADGLPAASPTATIPASEFVGPLDEPAVEYVAVVELDRVTAAPRLSSVADHAAAGANDSPRLCIREISGAVVVTTEGVSIPELRAHLGRLPGGAAGAVHPARDAQGFEQAEPAGSLVIRMQAQTTSPQPDRQGAVHAEVDLQDLDLTDPVEDLIAVFASAPAEFVRDIRQDRVPTGSVDARVVIDAPEGAPTRDIDIGVEFQAAQRLSARAFGGEVTVESPTGRVVVTRGGAPGIRPDRIRFDQLRADIGFNGTPAGAFTLNGGFAIGDGPQVLQGPANLECGVSDWRFEGGLTESLIRRFAGERAAERYQDAVPQGRFDAAVAAHSSDGPPILSGWIAPRSLQFTRRGEIIELSETSGRVSFQADVAAARSVADVQPGIGSLHGRIEQVRLNHPAWTIQADGEWNLAPRDSENSGARLLLDATLDATVTSLHPSISVLIPSQVSTVLSEAEIRFDSPLLIRADALRAEVPVDDPDQAKVGFEGHVDFDRLSAEAGLSFREARGRVTISAAADTEPGTAEPGVRLLVEAPYLRLAGIEMTDLSARASQPSPGVFRVDGAVANCHGGRVFGDVSALWSGSEAGSAEASPVRYRLNALMSGTQFAPLLDDLSRSNDAVAAAGTEAAAASLPQANDGDATRGVVDARLSLEGTSGDVQSRRGRGAIRIAHGDVLRLPVILPLMQVSNLMLPSRDRLDYLQSTFYIDGPLAMFDDIRVDSRSVSIVGSGVLTMPEMTLDMRFNTRSNQRIPLWSDLFEALRNEIASTTVTGTVERPVIRSETLSTTRRIIGDIVRPGDLGLPRDEGDARPASPEAPSEHAPLEFPRNRRNGMEPAPGRADAAGD